ncbi:uncharacterized protein C12orf71 homolog [Pipistrellus kuhlii]|uniref:uncharacterized protein C12orf71 homolog n=1 Tax=Pipistrellus kuhlii TaxID=59472 RepID=UPI00174F365E|nr:uncharacterized protein C12orf71 homolog [Pipistrellus kuhlii]
MADSSSCNNCADTEDSKSTLSLSVGYYPNEDTFPSKNTASCEDTSSHNPSIHFVPESIGRLMERQDQIQASTEQFGKLGIPLAWDGANPSDSIVNWDPYGESLWIDPEEKTKLTLSKLHRLEQFLENQKDEEDDEFIFPEFAQKEYFQLPSSTPPHVAQVSHQEHNTCLQDLPTFDPPENNATQCPQIPPKRQEHELAEVSPVTPQKQAGGQAWWRGLGGMLPAMKQGGASGCLTWLGVKEG